MWYVLIPLVLLMFSEEISKVSNNPTYDHYFKKYAPAGIDWTVLKRLAKIESSLGLNPLVIAGLVSTDGLSYGLMQLRLTTAKDFDPTATIQKLNDPEYSIKIAGQYLNWARNYLIKYAGITESNPRFLEYLVKSYNQGVGNTTKEIQGKIKINIGTEFMPVYASSYAWNYWDKFQKAVV